MFRPKFNATGVGLLLVVILVIAAGWVHRTSRTLAALRTEEAEGTEQAERTEEHRGDKKSKLDSLKELVEQAARDVNDAQARLNNCKEVLRRLKQAYEAAKTPDGKGEGETSKDAKPAPQG